MDKLSIITNTIKKEIPHDGGMILISSLNRQWFCDLQTSLGYYLINAQGKQIFITDTRYFLVASNKLAKHAEVWCIGSGPEETLTKLLANAISKLNIKTLLFEEEYITFNDYELIQQLPIKKFKSKELRVVKTDQEVDLLQKSADIIVDAINWVFTWIKPGYTEKEIAKKIAIKFIELGATENSFSTIVAAGKNGAQPHHRPSDYTIQDGDMVTIDCGCMYEDFASDMTRSFVVGKQCNTPEMITIYNTVFTAQQNGLAIAKVGTSTTQVDKACRDYIDATPYKGLFGHGTGHGVGLEVHELPVVSTKFDRPLEVNHVITIEPGIYKANVGGVRIEDTVIIKGDKLQNLTQKCSKQLMFIDNK